MIVVNLSDMTISQATAKYHPFGGDVNDPLLPICLAIHHLVKRSRPPANANIPPPTPAATPLPAYTAPGI